MKKNFQLSLLLFIALLALPSVAWADREVLQPQFGKQTITVASDEVITFKDPKGDTDYSGTTSENAQSLTVFQPAITGMSVQITFESMNMGGSNNYYSFANVYSGNPDADGTFNWATSTSEVPTSYSESNLPSGDILRAYPNERNKTYTNETYVSAAADGSLSVGFAYRYAYSCTGWVAKVRLVKLEDMTVTGAGSNYDGVVANPSSKQNVALANAYVTAEGVMNPDNVTGIYFNMTQNEGVVDPTALKLFKGETQVSATVEADGTGYKFVLNEVPADGTTTFTIKGDLLGTAAVGAKVQVDITKITTSTHATGITPFTAGTSVVVTNPALVLMSSTPQTVTVGETSLLFFDQGGVNGGIQANTNGQVTFLSGNADKKVMVNFTLNQIWHGTYYNQELRIYNGQTVDAANLIKTLQQDETGIVRSTAKDGSLTVVLFSDASSTTAANGFEAEVSLFTPQPMDFNGITATAASTETVCAGDEEQDMLTIDVAALNTEPAMQVTKMAFSAGDNYALVTKAALYYGSEKVGETVLEGSAFEITLTTPQALTEGDNVFTLKYDISDEAVNDQTVSAQAVSVTALVNGTAKTEAVTGSVTVSRTVRNIVLSHKDQGTVTKTVNGSIAFETKTASSYSSYCEAGTDDRINIFVPKNSGMVCQIDFSEFEVQYASSSYGNKSTFKIYAGQGTTGTLLWELNDNAQQNVGPEQIIRSTSADGALTIVFNPKSSYSYYYKGWKATVSEYQSKDMEVAAVEATQTTTADVSIGAVNQELLTVNVQTEGNLNALAMSSMKLNLKGTEANLTKVSVWQDDTKLGEAAAAAEVTVTFTESVTLVEGNNTFAVKTDVSEDGVENQTIDAKVVSVHVGSADVAATAGDPDGARTLKNQILMTAGDHGTLNLGLGKTVAIYDDGGPEGDGADGVEATITLATSGEADCIKLTDKGISFSYTAHLYIYKGSEVNADNLIIDLSGSSAKFAPIITDAAFDGGKLTIKYVGAGSYTKPNFAVEAEGYKKTDVVVTGVTTEDISVSEVLKGQTDVKMLKVMVEAKGELNPATITAFNITGTDGEAVDACHIYQTGTVTSFSANEEFSGSYSITNSGTYYFWLTYDVKTTAIVGQTATATLTDIVVNGSPVDVTTPSTATITVVEGMSGTLLVGEGTRYPTIQGAIDAVAMQGMEGPVVLKIKAGEYNEKVRVPYIMGMGSVNTLTIESESGQRDVKIFHNQYTTAGYIDDQHKKDYGVVTLYQANYVTLKNLEITTTDLNYKAVVMIKDESRHATIDNCYLHTDIYASTSGDGPALVGHTIIDEENKNNDYLAVKNSLLEGGKYGVYMGGTSYVALPKEVGAVIEGNTFKNNGRFMLYSYDELGAKIRNNTFVIDDASVYLSNGVIDINVRDEYSESTEITGNIFNLASANTVAAIYVRQMEGTAAAPAVIANNVVNLSSANASCTPFKFSGAKQKYVNVANNTFRMTGTNGGAAFWASSALANGYGNVNVVNNIIQNETNGYAVNLYNDGNLGIDKINFQNNVMFTAGTTFFRAASSTTGDFAAFVTATGATNCVNKRVTFASDDILMPANNLDGDLLTAQSLNYVTTDITGKTRPASGITIGAYEFDTTDAVPAMTEGYPTVSVSGTEASMDATISIKADAMGRAFLIVKAQGETAPTVDEVVASTTKTTIQADTEASFSWSDLQENTTYVAYIVLQSIGGTNGTLITKEFATSEQPVELVIACTESVTTVASGTETSLKVMVASGKAPFTVSWIDSKHNTVVESFESSLLGEEISMAFTPDRSGDFIVTVTDAQNKMDTDTCRVIVTGEAMVADFEYLYLENNSYWAGPDWKGVQEESLYGPIEFQGSFVSGSYSFANNYIPEYSSWSSFGYANKQANTYYDLMEDMCNSTVGGARRGDNYAVFFGDAMGLGMSPTTVKVLHDPNGQVIPGFYITNAAYVVDAILHGDGSFNTGETDAQGNTIYDSQGNVVGQEEFHEGDFLKLTITADNNEEIEFYLADYRSADENDWYYVKDWQYVDLSSLGTVKELEFALTASRTNSWGYTTPLYFCMDDFGAEGPLTLDEDVTFDVTTVDPDKEYDVILKRHIYDDFNTLTLPFDVTKQQLSQLGSQMKVYELTGYNGTTLTIPAIDLTQKADNDIVLVANHPYIFKDCQELTQLTFQGVTISTAGAAAGKQTFTNADDADDFVTFEGSYDASTDLTGKYGVTPAGKIAPVKAGTTVKGYHAFFTLSKTAGNKAARLSVNFDNDGTTGIEDLNNGYLNENSTTNVYDMQGRHISPHNSTAPLKKGIYVVNGKKIIVK